MKNNYLLMAIVAILAIVVVKFAFFGGYNERSVERLLKKNFSKNNYSVNIKMNSKDAQDANFDSNLKRKDDIYLYEMDYGYNIEGLSSINSKATVYIDLANDDVVMTMFGIALVGHVSELTDEYSVDNMDKSSEIMKNLKEKGIQFKYLGLEKYDSKECIRFELTKKDKTPISDTTYREEIYMDKKEGSIERLIAYDKNDKVVADADFEFEFNVVTDSDVAKPSTAGMSVMDLSEFKK